MAKVSILEGQLERNFSGVKLLRTDLSGGGSCEWIPEDKIQLTTLNIRKNGTYKASDYTDRDGNKYYGFSEVTVNVTGRTTIVDPEDGNEYSVETDTETGELKKTVLPSTIDIVGLPTKTMYRDGDPINKSGIVVKAYLADGTLYNYKNYQFGGIPLSELDIDPTIAVSDGDIGVDTDLDISPVPKPFSVEVGLEASVGSQRQIAKDYQGTVFVTGGYGHGGDTNRGFTILASENPFKYGVYISNVFYSEGVANQATINGKTVYYATQTTEGTPVIPEDVVPNLINAFVDTSKFQNIAWAMVYGEKKDGTQEITVKWKRPEDHKELTDVFKVAVIPKENSGGETQGSDTGGDGNTTGGGGGSW